MIDLAACSIEALPEAVKTATLGAIDRERRRISAELSSATQIEGGKTWAMPKLARTLSNRLNVLVTAASARLIEQKKEQD